MRRGYCKSSSDEMSQTFIVLSLFPLAMRFSSGLKVTPLTILERPLGVSISWPV